MTRRFKRKTIKYVHFIEIILALIVGISYIYLMIIRKIDSVAEIALVIIVIFLVINDIIEEVIPKDFEYNIIAKDDVILFEIGEEKRLLISKRFEVVKKTKQEITLKDENSTITIPYNRKVLKFLKKIQE